MAPKTFFDSPDWLVPDGDVDKIERNKTKDQRSNTDVYESFGKTVFGNWILTKPQETKKVTLTYELPFRTRTMSQQIFYDLPIQKQSGSDISDFHLSLTHPITWEILASDFINGRTQRSIEDLNETYSIPSFSMEKDTPLHFLFHH